MAVFQNHTIICGWNSRATSIVRMLRSITPRAIIVVAPDITVPVREVGALDDVFTISGDPSHRHALLSADVATAKSVIVLQDEALGAAADARSVQIALAVERLQVTVHTVVELRDLANRSHFEWTKVDEVVSSEELSARIIAQAIRHVVGWDYEDTHDQIREERQLLELYHQLIGPKGDKSQLIRIDVPWGINAPRCFGDLIERCLETGCIPTALVGFRSHLIAARPGIPAWHSWKTDVWSSPEPGLRLQDRWPEWPEKAHLGVIILAASAEQATAATRALS